jgi:hypothetical protein
VHAVAALKKSGERGVWEMVLHLEQMDKLWHTATLLYDLLQVEVGVADELVNCFLVGEDAVLIRLTVLEHT